ncbi:hypothetical protein [Chryseobacterium terrae]|uniref:Uncharacterized protein n=1 Tax=Chryseobacterium terrae TaxID=3163299 RepID=A0ABW8Y6P9_9FLAO
MKDAIKMILVGMMSFIAIARSCVKTGAKVAHVSEPMLMEARYLKNAGALEKEGISAANTFKSLKTTKDAADVKAAIEKLNEINDKDTIKNIKQKKAKKRIKK